MIQRSPYSFEPETSNVGATRPGDGAHHGSAPHDGAPLGSDEVPQDRRSLEQLFSDLQGAGADLLQLAAIRGERVRHSLRRAVWRVVGLLAGLLATAILVVIASTYFVRGIAGAFTQGLGLPGWVGALGAAVVVLGGIGLVALWIYRRWERAARERVRSRRTAGEA